MCSSTLLCLSHSTMAFTYAWMYSVIHLSLRMPRHQIKHCQILTQNKISGKVQHWEMAVALQKCLVEVSAAECHQWFIVSYLWSVVCSSPGHAGTVRSLWSPYPTLNIWAQVQRISIFFTLLKASSCCEPHVHSTLVLTAYLEGEGGVREVRYVSTNIAHHTKDSQLSHIFGCFPRAERKW